MEHTIYLILAVAGGTLLAAQVLLQAIGVVGGDADVDHGHADGYHSDHDAGHGNLFLSVLSLKALAAFMGIFGLTGLALEDSDISTGLRVSFALEAGIVAMVTVALLMRGLSKLTHVSTMDVRTAVGQRVPVYLKIPAARRGSGKVTVHVQGRSMQLDAVTDEEEIPTGAQVEVVDVLGGETLQVRRPIP